MAKLKFRFIKGNLDKHGSYELTKLPPPRQVQVLEKSMPSFKPKIEGYEIINAHGLTETEDLSNSQIIISYRVTAKTNGHLNGILLERNKLKVNPNDTLLPLCMTEGIKFLSKRKDKIDFICPADATFSHYLT